MDNLFARIQSLCEEKGIRPGRLCDELNLSRSLMTDLKMGRKKSQHSFMFRWGICWAMKGVRLCKTVLAANLIY